MRRISQQRLGDAAKEAVNERESDLKRMIDSVPGIAWSADASGNFDYVNVQWDELTGLSQPQSLDDWQLSYNGFYSNVDGDHSESQDNANGVYADPGIGIASPARVIASASKETPSFIIRIHFRIPLI